MGVVFTQPIASHGGLNWDTNLEAALTELKTKANSADLGIPGADLNLITTSGTYYGSSLGHSPAGSTQGFFVWVIVRDNANQVQLAINVNSSVMYFRAQLSGVWPSAWKTVTAT